MEEEIWLDIKEYEGLYKVSSHGRVWSYPKKGKGGHNGKMLSAGKDTNGYLKILLLKDKKRKTITIHRLVASAFIPNPNNYPIILHGDDNTANNYYKNLSWGTNKMNSEDMINKGRANKARGEKHGLAKLTEQQVLEIRAKYTGKYGEQKQLAIEYNIKHPAISEIISRKQWKHI